MFGDLEIGQLFVYQVGSRLQMFQKKSASSAYFIELGVDGSIHNTRKFIEFREALVVHKVGE